MQLGLLITSRCNAACTHCATSCGPQRHEHLERGEILRLMQEAAALRPSGAQEPLEFCISGGEPFLDLPLLLDIVRHGAALGGIIACQTNGYWASSDDKARAVLSPLREAGLASLGLSVSRFHQEYVRRQRVERALAVAREFGIQTTLKCALVRGDEELEAWARTCTADCKEIFPVHPYLRAGGRIAEGALRRRSALPAEACPAAVLTVREDGQTYSCCSPGAFNEFLYLGNVRELSLEELHERFQMGGRQQLLRRHGPGHFAQEIIRRGHGARLRPAYADACDLCAHLGRDPLLSALAAGMASQFEAQQLEELLEALCLAADA